MKIKEIEQGNEVQPAENMKIGDVAKIAKGPLVGEYILRTFNGYVSLSNPKNTWTEVGCPPDVVILPKGTKLELTV